MCTRPVSGIDHLRQLVGVGAAQLGQAAVLEDHARQFVLVGDRLQRLLVRRRLRRSGVFTSAGSFSSSNSSAHTCLGESRLKVRPASSVALLLRGEHALAEVGRLPAQFVGVDQHAVGLDALEHRHQRHLDLAVDALQRRLGGELRRAARGAGAG